jgi:hypothetical protein
MYHKAVAYFEMVPFLLANQVASHLVQEALAI